MPLVAAQLIVLIGAAYAGIGLAFACLFIPLALARVDHAAHGAPLGFRLVILPGIAALWPLMLRRWIALSSRTPSEARRDHP